MRLEGKVGIITGSGGAFGRSAARLFAREGAKVIVTDIKRDAGEETVDLIKQAGGDAIFVAADVSRAADVQGLVRGAVEAYGKLNVMVNNAGIWFAHSIEDLSEDDWRRNLDINLTSVFLGCKYAIPEIRRAGGGSIINTASGAAIVGSKGAPAYSAAKAGVALLSKSLAIVHGKEHIRVNAVCPGAVATGLYDTTGMTREQVEANWSATIPMGHLGTPDDIGYAMVYLASDESAFVTGAMLSVDGGFTAA